MALQAVFCYDGIGYQRVRRHDTAEQQGGLPGIVEQVDACIIDHDEGDEEREQSENGHLPKMLFCAFHVHFESCEEHDEVESHLSEDFKRGVALQDIQPVFSHQHARQHHSDDMWDAQFGHNHRREQDDAEHDEENPCGICYWEICAEVEHELWFVFTIRLQR